MGCYVYVPISRSFSCFTLDFPAAIGLAQSVSGFIGCRYLTVDSKPESMSFYERLGFRMVEKYKQTDFPKMYIDMQPVVERMQPEESLEDF